MPGSMLSTLPGEVTKACPSSEVTPPPSMIHVRAKRLSSNGPHVECGLSKLESSVITSTPLAEGVRPARRARRGSMFILYMDWRLAAMARGAIWGYSGADAGLARREVRICRHRRPE